MFCTIHTIHHIIRTNEALPPWRSPNWLVRTKFLSSGAIPRINFMFTHSGNVKLCLCLCLWCGARPSESKSNAVNFILRLLLYHFLHTMSSWHHKSIHNNTNNQQTPPPWWWSRLPLQRRGFDESMLPDGQAALRIYFPRLTLKGLVKFNKVM